MPLRSARRQPAGTLRMLWRLSYTTLRFQILHSSCRFHSIHRSLPSRKSSMNRRCFCGSAWGMLVLVIAGVCTAAEKIPVEQAGDRFVNFVLEEIEATRKAIPAMSAAADRAAERIVKLDGE